MQPAAGAYLSWLYPLAQYQRAWTCCSACSPNAGRTTPLRCLNAAANCRALLAVYAHILSTRQVNAAVQPSSRHMQTRPENISFTALAWLSHDFIFFTLQMRQPILPGVWSLSRGWAAPLCTYAEQHQQSGCWLLTEDAVIAVYTSSLQHTHTLTRTNTPSLSKDPILGGN